MEAREQRVVLILADISGYTRFIVANQTTALHGQLVIAFLIETILKEVDIPLTLHGIEGDAVFLSASHPGDDAGWQDVLAQVRTKLDRFFDVFLDGILRIGESTICDCASCEHVGDLKLKIIVHTGRAVFSTIAGLPQVSGADVILAHRLLKNSVAAREYLLMSESAYEDIGVGMEGTFVEGEEDCEGIGRVRTRVRLMGEDRDEALAALDATEPREIVAATRKLVVLGGLAQYVMLWRHLRRPSVPASLPSRLAFAIRHAFGVPAYIAKSLAASPRRVLERRRARQAASSGAAQTG